METENVWTGTATELLVELRMVTPEPIAQDRAFPRAPNHLAGRLRRLAPALRVIGINASSDRSGPNGERIWTISKSTDGTDDPDDDFMNPNTWGVD